MLHKTCSILLELYCISLSSLQCSVTCGIGMVTRETYCQEDLTGMKVDIAHCGHRSRPLERSICTRHEECAVPRENEIDDPTSNEIKPFFR